ncbi:NAD-dependent epimerase/dehydratase family protein, partial [Nonlabens mediterrranea]|nr:NAD-dependent epimerase/dehydratase family protein [Nonlabens mediterrranea]
MKVLITGATGLVGSQIADLFISKGHTVHYLTTRSNAIKNEKHYKGFLWDVKNMTIDSSCITGVDTIIHLAGESVFQRWTEEAKESIMSSRIDSTQLLINLLKDNNHQVQQVITASAIGIYPDDPEAEAFKENDIPPYANNYLAEVCIAWESIAQQFRETGVQLSIVRIGIVLAALCSQD